MALSDGITIPGSLEYQVQIKENSSDAKSGDDVITEERLQAAFQLMRELIPQMGVHKALFELIFSELHKSVFSKELTVSADASMSVHTKQGGTAAPVQYQSYFTLYHNLVRSRDEKAESLQSYIGSLQDSLSEKESILEGCRNQVADLNEHVSNLSAEKSDLEQKLVQLTNTITKLDSSFKEFVSQKDISDLHYEDEILNLQSELNSTSMELERIEKFETLYNELDNDFIAEEMQINKMPAQIVPASNKNSVLVDLKSCQALERQLLTVQNSLIEEFDQHMEKYREKMESANLAKNFRDNKGSYEKDEKFLAEVDTELAEKQRVFRRTIEDVEAELEMLSIHRENLEVNRDRIKLEEEEKARDLAPAGGGGGKQDKKGGPNKQEKKGSEDKDKEAPMTAAQREAMETVFDKLDAQEQITSKYSSIIYFSNNRGKTFYELPQNSLCNSCGTTTMICPHKVARQDWVVDLPPNTHMLRISRPKLKLQKKLDDREIEALFSKQLKQAAQQNTTGDKKIPPQEEQTEATKVDGSEGGSRSQSKASMGDNGVAVVSQADVEELQDDALYFSRIRDIQEGLAPITQKLPEQFERIWADFRQRTSGSLRLIPRQISEERVVSIAEQFLSQVLWTDRSVDVENIPSIVDSLYSMFESRFLIPKMAHFTLFDFFSSLQHFAANNIVLLTLVQCVSGDLDFSSLRILVHLGQLIKSIQWTSLDDLYWLIHVAFDFLPAEECDNLVLDYVSFSKNCLSAELVMHFFFYLTLKNRDPRISHSEIRLCQFPCADPGYMSEMEFTIAINDMVHMHSVPLRTRLFNQALKAQQQQRPRARNQDNANAAVLAPEKDKSKGLDKSRGKEGGVVFETLVRVAAYLELLDSFETAKKKFSEGDRNERQAEYPKGLKIRTVADKNPIISADSLLKLANNFSQRERSRIMRNMQASIDKVTSTKK
ncbi:uncharacterized protein LOC134853869 [Symsagittifera roscoffensis]|uniref:uncharacterized protein LOC134853869 n=1 Tax=Symsagittifera roscoffensis TaxID=84072 RepID=UPI00307BC667